MDPNSQHQLWSKWVFRIHPGGTKAPSYCDVRENAARFGRLRFGMTSAMEVKEEFNTQTRKTEWKISVRSEGHPVHDPQYVAWMTEQWATFAFQGFGVGTVIDVVEAKLEAGDRQDGRPRDQLIIMDAAFLPKLREETEP